MTRRIALVLLAVQPAFVFASALLSSRVLKQVPREYRLNDPQHASARAELEELVEKCGDGVVAGVNAKNRCNFQVELDDLFFTPMEDRTGYIADRNWPYREGATWVEPLDVRASDNFDLRDLMTAGQPVIKAQQCGDCWAWATHHGLEIARAVHDHLVLDLSIQTVLSCSQEGSCNGGTMDAVDFLKHGLPLESEFPYAASDKQCKFSSSQINTGWDGKVIGTPYIGSSLDYSRGNRSKNGSFREGKKVQNMIAAMDQWKSPIVLTVAAYDISGGGVYDSCSSINSMGNHMVTVVGYEMWNNKRVAHVWNSWGQNHGQNGVSRIQWECGDGKLNRGLGYEAKIVQYKSPCTPPNAAQDFMHEVMTGKGVQIGSNLPGDVKCTWLPTTGLSNPNSCMTQASPSQTTEYHLTAENACGKSSSMTLVQVWGRGVDSGKILTPYGVVKR